ncbi:MAG: tetratricopeptide repeat protein [Desulfobacterales bacterium]|nr:MAG: tetratricopeptide repeat protein [Desulfobacterales bacterium]
MIQLSTESYVSGIFSVLAGQRAQMSAMANNAIGAGIDKYQKGDYKSAIIDFKRSIALDPQSAYAAEAANYMALAYLKLDQDEEAVEAYKTSTRLNPFRDDTHIKLGNLYLDLNRLPESETEYKEAVRLNPDVNNYYALGNFYLQTQRYNEAETQFQTILSLSQHGGKGNYGLGMVYSQQGRYEKAIDQFKESIRLTPDFAYGYLDLGYAYADAGQIDEAVKQMEILEKMDPALADMLSRHLYKAEAPRIEFASSQSTFPYYFGPYTPLSALDTYLLNANTSRPFTVVFQFSKEMDRSSVENRFNWNISRSSQGGPGQAYYFGQDVPQTEVTLSPFPELVVYDEDNFRATVTFRIYQNAAADGTLDPSHLVFKFSGEDVFGNPMDSKADEFCDFIDVH